MTSATTSLPTIIAHARAGSLDHAWAMFAAGYGESRDPAALAIKGRLLKDRALRVSGEARAALYGEAAEAYPRAAGDDGATYPLINAAALSLLSGDAGKAAALAGQVLARIEANPDEPETPYYLAATRAEALLLLGQSAEAQAALGEAVARAPRAWEDHASTLRQFALILGCQGADAGWLDQYRPGRSLHFGGHMSFRADARPTPLTERIAALIAGERIGFGYGALAAGADILVAEALVAAGAELHLVIPGGLDAFAALSVDPFGGEWRRRFDAMVALAATVRAVEPLNLLPDAIGIALADEIAMGAARINARQYASEALQLIVLAEGADEAKNHSLRVWASGGGRQLILRAPRDPVDPPLPAPPRRQACLAALAVRADGDALTAIAD
ncbi:MAG: tetratricopeptide repeat-containing protein, partial [Sphingomonas sp.]